MELILPACSSAMLLFSGRFLLLPWGMLLFYPFWHEVAVHDSKVMFLS